jgi:hypothetical protein
MIPGISLFPVRISSEEEFLETRAICFGQVKAWQMHADEIQQSGRKTG